MLQSRSFDNNMSKQGQPNISQQSIGEHLLPGPQKITSHDEEVDCSKKNSSLAEFLNVSSSNAGRGLDYEHVDNGQINEDLGRIGDAAMPEIIHHRQ
jgi:hypothetical protein